MSLGRMLVMVFVIGSVCAFAHGEEGDGARMFEKAGNLLKQGDFDNAMRAYMGAAKAAPGNSEYSERAMLIRRVMMLRNFLDQNEDSPNWDRTVVSLHSFYLTEGLHKEALTLTQRAHEKRNNALTASLLAGTYLETGDNEAALKLLDGLNGERIDTQNSVYRGIALARLGKLDEAKKVRADCPPADKMSIGLLCDVARLDTLLDDQKSACTLLTHCFQQTPPSQLARVKGFVKDCNDFNALKSAPGFSNVMQTLSQISESSCSGGSSCGSCPNSKQCGSQAATQTATQSSDCGTCDKKSSSDCGSCDKK